MPTLLAHSLQHVAEACLALPACPPLPPTTGQEFLLAGSIGGACYYGVGAMMQWQKTANMFPLLISTGNNAALTHEAIRQGIKYVHCQLPLAMFAQLSHIANAQGATLYEDYPHTVIDMRDRQWKEQIHEPVPAHHNPS